VASSGCLWSSRFTWSSSALGIRNLQLLPNVASIERESRKKGVLEIGLNMPPRVLDFHFPFSSLLKFENNFPALCTLSRTHFSIMAPIIVSPNFDFWFPTVRTVVEGLFTIGSFILAFLWLTKPTLFLSCHQKTSDAARKLYVEMRRRHLEAKSHDVALMKALMPPWGARCRDAPGSAPCVEDRAAVVGSCGS
jgi:hypothetical protein